MSAQFPASAKCCATRHSCPVSSCRHQHPIAFVATHRFENVTISGAPGRSTRAMSRNTSAGRARYWIAAQIVAPSNSDSGKRQKRIAVEILYPPFVEKRIFGERAALDADADDPPVRRFRREMRDPSRHNIEDRAACRQHLTVEVGNSGNRRAVYPSIRRFTREYRVVCDLGSRRGECAKLRHDPVSTHARSDRNRVTAAQVCAQPKCPVRAH